MPTDMTWPGAVIARPGLGRGFTRGHPNQGKEVNP
jgi:hypothetical protein